MATLDTIARPYALAVFTIAEEAGEIDAWSSHLHFLEALSLNKDVVSFAENPTATQSDIEGVLLSVVQNCQSLALTIL